MSTVGSTVDLILLTIHYANRYSVNIDSIADTHRVAATVHCVYNPSPHVVCVCLEIDS